ncbi:methionyl-tRNA formyltransferase [Fusibacter ferrireducens]|uniref:Methionyl-tRNA formyltransferase n=1 Tax=Fusibacter ferrireducens TaxID=2785058 RepID=A0ABR9ZMX8_9FIRM|nr:methionyl-tRNA formyltransferase [Fusibacter ferrireducens]MBF4691671.1 methionyl-tRNA formyltransferase [Fusibacter ferrireducens]
MKIIFMGTPEFSVGTLEACIQHHDVIGVFTQPDKPKGRGKQMTKPPVKVVAEAHDISVFQPDRIKKGDWTQLIRELAPDCIVVVAYGQILSKAILEIPKYGCINVHASLLPKLRGAAPINWAIVNGEVETGVTTMKMDVGLDTGDMLLKETIQIDDEMTAGELHDHLAIMGAQLLVKTLEGLENDSIVPEKQDDNHFTYAPMLNKELARMDWHLSAKRIKNLIRGFNPWPVAHTTYQGKTLKVYKANALAMEDLDALELTNYHKISAHGAVIGVRKNSILIKAESSVLEILEIQWGSAKRMPCGAFLLGHSVEIGTQLI